MPIQEPTRQTTREDDAGGQSGAGPLASLKGNKFQFSAYNYPIDIENLSHAMLFNIRVHESSKDIRSQNQESTRETTETTINTSRRDRLLNGTPNVARRYTQIKRAISLYMPDTIVFENKQNYEAPSLLEKLGIVGTSLVAGEQPFKQYLGSLDLGAISSAVTGLRDTAAAALGIDQNTLRGSLGAAAAGLVKQDRTKITPTLRTAAQLSGYALNPVIEVLYSTPLLRAFSFDFIFSPRNKKEADVVWKIIMEFRRHSAPEFGAFSGSILIPPSEFQITFLRKGSTNESSNLNRELAPGEPQVSSGASGTGFIENTNMPRISTCVLTNVQVDYAPTGGYVTFEDGMPVQIRMRLDFMEINMITREMIDKGY